MGSLPRPRNLTGTGCAWADGRLPRAVQLLGVACVVHSVSPAPSSNLGHRWNKMPAGAQAPGRVWDRESRLLQGELAVSPARSKADGRPLSTGQQRAGAHRCSRSPGSMLGSQNGAAVTQGGRRPRPLSLTWSVHTAWGDPSAVPDRVLGPVTCPKCLRTLPPPSPRGLRFLQASISGPSAATLSHPSPFAEPWACHPSRQETAVAGLSFGAGACVQGQRGGARGQRWPLVVSSPRNQDDFPNQAALGGRHCRAGRAWSSLGGGGAPQSAEGHPAPGTEG